MKKFLSLLLMTVLAASVGWAAESVFYTLTPASGKNNAYANNCDVDIDGITWNITGNSQQQPWRIGGKNLTNEDKEVYSKTAMGSAISKVELTVGSASSITVNSLTLTVASDAEFKTKLDEVSATFAANSTITFNPSTGTEWAKNAYYKFTFNVTVSGSSNKFLEFTKAAFYANKDEGGGDEPQPATKYAITYGTGMVGGSISGPAEAAAGDKVDVTVTPEANYTLESLSYNGNDITEAKSFTMPAEAVTVRASFKEIETPEPGDVTIVTDVLTNSNTIGEDTQNYKEWTAKATSNAEYKGQSAGKDGTIQLRTNNNNSGIVTTVSGGTLTKVTIKFNSSTTTKRKVDVYGSNTAYTSPENLYKDETKGTLLETVEIQEDVLTKTVIVDGTYKFVGLRSNSGALYLDEVDVEWLVDKDALTPPSISGTTPFAGSTEVTITNPNTAGEVRYTTDGSDPTANSDAYTGPFTINETTTVKAIVVLDGKTSDVASKEFVALPAYSTLAEVVALDKGTEFVFSGEATVIHQYSNYIYIQDATAGNLIYGSVGAKYNDGDVIPAGWSGKATTYSSAPEVESPTGFAASEKSVELEAIELTVDQITAANFSRYAVVKGATVSASGMTVGETTVPFRTNRTTYTLPEDLTKTYDVYGITDFTNSGAQFMPMSFVEVTPATYTVTFDEVEGVTFEPQNEGNEFEEGAEVSFKVTPAAHYAIDEVTAVADDQTIAVDLQQVEPDYYTFTMPAANVTVSAITHEIQPNAITVAETENGTVALQDNENGEAYPGDAVYFTATADEHFVIDLDNVAITTTDGATVEYEQSDDLFSFTMPEGDVTINVPFKQYEFQITLADADNVEVEGIVNEDWYAAGEDIVFSANAVEGYVLQEVVVEQGDDYLEFEMDNDLYSFTMPEGDVTVRFTVTEAQSKLYAIGEVNGIGWVTNNGAEFAFNEETEQYELEVTAASDTNSATVYFSLTTQLVEGEADWDGIAPYRLTAQGEDNLDFAINRKNCNEIALISFNEYPHSFSIPSGDYKLIVNKDLTKLSVEGFKDVLYIISDATGWKTNNGLEMPFNEETGNYEVELNAVNGDNKQFFFTIATDLVDGDQDWDDIAPYRLGAQGANGNYEINADNAEGITLESNDKSFVIPAGVYTLSVNAEKNLLTVKGDFPVEVEGYFLVGSFNGWNQSEDAMTAFNLDEETGHYVAEQAMDAKAQLKIKDANGYWYGAEVGEGEENFVVNASRIEAGDPIQMLKDGGMNVLIEPAGTWTFDFDPTNGSLIITGEPLKYAITVAETENGTVEANSETAIEGETVTLTVTPAEHYALDQLSVATADGTTVEVTDNNTFTMPAADVTVTATFKQVEFSILIDESTNVAIEGVQNEQWIAAGATVEFSVVPDEGYKLSSLRVIDNEQNAINLQQVEGDNNYTFTMPESDVHFFVTAEEDLEEMTLAEIIANGEVGETYVIDTEVAYADEYLVDGNNGLIYFITDGQGNYSGLYVNTNDLWDLPEVIGAGFKAKVRENANGNVILEYVEGEEGESNLQYTIDKITLTEAEYGPKPMQLHKVMAKYQEDENGEPYISQFVNGRGYRYDLDVTKVSGFDKSDMEVRKTYTFTVVRFNKATAAEPAPALKETTGTYTSTEIELVLADADVQFMTGIETLLQNVEAKSVRYYNLQGVELSEPANGVNIVVIEHVDGSTTSHKVLK